MNINKIKEDTKNLLKDIKVPKDLKILKKIENPIKVIVFGKFTNILVRLELIDDDIPFTSINHLDLLNIKNIVIKDINKNEYRKIQRNEIYSYYIDEDFLYLTLINNEKLKIRFN